MSTEDTPAEGQTFEAVINKHVAEIKTDDAGKLVMPEGIDEPTAFAIRAEVRRRDTQAAYSRTTNELLAVKAENEALASGWEQDVTKLLTPTQNAELEELKATDPEAWRQKLNEHEQANRAAFGTKRTEIKEKATELSEVERRQALLEQFNKDNPTIQLTDEVLANDVPPRIVKQLERGEVTFEEFLVNTQKFLTGATTIAGADKPMGDPNMGDLGGSSKPTDTAVEADATESYKTETY